MLTELQRAFDSADHAERCSLANIERLEAALLPLPPVEIPVEHRFAPGVYMREVTMPAGAFVIGHEHKTEHFNVVLSGSARVLIDGVLSDLKAPAIFVSGAGVRKILLITEEMRFATVHATHETDVAKLEAALIRKSAAFLAHEEIQKLTQG